MASLPLPASATTSQSVCPSMSLRSPERMTSWSSAIRTRIMRPTPGLARRSDARRYSTRATCFVQQHIQEKLSTLPNNRACGVAGLCRRIIGRGRNVRASARATISGTSISTASNILARATCAPVRSALSESARASSVKALRAVERSPDENAKACQSLRQSALFRAFRQWMRPVAEHGGQGAQALRRDRRAGKYPLTYWSAPPIVVLGLNRASARPGHHCQAASDRRMPAFARGGAVCLRQCQRGLSLTHLRDEQQLRRRGVEHFGDFGPAPQRSRLLDRRRQLAAGNRGVLSASCGRLESARRPT